MQPKLADHDTIIVLKKRYIRFVKNKFEVKPMHLIATFLTPAFSKYKFSNRTVSTAADEELKNLIDIVNESGEELISDDDSDDEDDSLFGNFKIKIKKTKLPANEIERYRDTEFTMTERDIDVFEFWNENRKRFPKLSRIAISLLSAPATNNSSERVFSACGNFITPNRNKLKPKIVYQLIFGTFSIPFPQGKNFPPFFPPPDCIR